MKVSVIIPVYNEESTLGEVIERVDAVAVAAACAVAAVVTVAFARGRSSWSAAS